MSRWSVPALELLTRRGKLIARGLTSMNWDEYWANNPKGRHCLNGSDSVMLL